MKSGVYKVSFVVELNDCLDQDEAESAVASLVSDILDEDKFPEVKFELLEEFDVEYNTEENEVPELNFEGMA